jgi:hypothetical protein
MAPKMAGKPAFNAPDAFQERPDCDDCCAVCWQAMHPLHVTTGMIRRIDILLAGCKLMLHKALG